MINNWFVNAGCVVRLNVLTLKYQTSEFREGAGTGNEKG